MAPYLIDSIELGYSPPSIFNITGYNPDGIVEEHGIPLYFSSSVLAGAYTLTTEKMRNGKGCLKIDPASVNGRTSIIGRYQQADIPELNVGTGDITLENWVLFDPKSLTGVSPWHALSTNGRLGGFLPLISYGNGQNVWTGIGNHTTDGNTFSNSIGSGPASVVSGILPMTWADIVANRWYHFALVRHNGVLMSFIDGVLVKSIASTVAISGGITTLAAAVYGGYYQDIAIYNLAKYTENFTPV